MSREEVSPGGQIVCLLPEMVSSLRKDIFFFTNQVTFRIINMKFDRGSLKNSIFSILNLKLFNEKEGLAYCLYDFTDEDEKCTSIRKGQVKLMKTNRILI